MQFKISLRATSSCYNYQKDNKNKKWWLCGGVGSLYLKRNKLVKEALPINLIFTILPSENEQCQIYLVNVSYQKHIFFEKVMV